MPYQATEATKATRVRRRAALLAAATTVVAEHGFQLATVKSVAAVARMSVGSVYLHFPTKAELLAAVFRRAADVELSAVRTAVSDAREDASATDEHAQTAAIELAALVNCFAQRAIRGRRLAWSLLLEPVDREIEAERLVYRKAYAETVTDILSRGIASGELGMQDPRLSGAAIVGAIGESLTGQLSPLRACESDSPDTVVSAITALCLRAAGASDAATAITTITRKASS